MDLFIVVDSNYRFTQANIDDLASNSVTVNRNGVPVKDGDSIKSATFVVNCVNGIQGCWATYGASGLSVYSSVGALGFSKKHNTYNYTGLKISFTYVAPKPVVEYTKISAQNIIDFANSNVKVYLDGVEAVEGAKLNSVEFKAICNTGFKFTDDSAYIVYENGESYNSSGDLVPNIVTEYLLLNADYSEATTTTDDFNYSEIVLNTVEDEPVPVNDNLVLTQTLIDDYKARHFVLKDSDGVPLAVGNSLNNTGGTTYLYAYADDGYYFENTLNLVDFDGVNYPFNIAVNTSLCILSGDLKTKVIESLTGEAIIKPVIEYTKISAQNIIDFANSNVKVYLDGVEAVEGAKLNSVEFKAICNTGFKFTDDSAYIAYKDGESYNTSGDLVPNIVTTYLLLNADYSEATTTTDDFNYSEIVLNTVADDVPTISGTNSIYLINNSILDDVNENRFVTSGAADGSLLDYGVYILKLLEFPFDVPLSVLDDAKNILLADRDTNVSAVTLKDDVFKIDLGVINVTGDKGNLLDYVDKVAMIHLPYSQPIDLDLNYVINETISIEYLISVYTGDATINIYSSKLGDVISTTTTNIGVNIPFISSASDLSIKNDGIGLGGNNGVTRPYIEIVETDKILADGFYTIPVIDESVLTGQTGFIRIEEINLQSNASKQNKELLISLLKEGVIIN